MCLVDGCRRRAARPRATGTASNGEVRQQLLWLTTDKRTAQPTTHQEQRSFVYPSTQFHTSSPAYLLQHLAVVPGRRRGRHEAGRVDAHDPQPMHRPLQHLHLLRLTLKRVDQLGPPVAGLPLRVRGRAGGASGGGGGGGGGWWGRVGADAAAAEQAVDELRLASACATEGGGDASM